MIINRQLFFQNVRDSLFGGKLTNGQVSGMEAILNMAGEMITDERQVAYILATIYHEVDKTMQPIEEYGRGKNKDYGTNLKMDRSRYTDSAKLYYGRGLVQITWYENYKKLSDANTHGWDFFHFPETALDLVPSAWAAVYGMKTGLFTGKNLDRYINADKCDPYNARRIINGTDKATVIAGYFYKFLNAMQ